MSEHLEQRLKSHTYHRPSAAVQDTMSILRQSYMTLAEGLDTAVPECREKSLAFTALEESAMWGMKALALTDADGVVISPVEDRDERKSP